MQTILLPTMIPVVRTCTCILHTARSPVVIVGDGGDAAGAGRVEPIEHIGGEGANAHNTGDDSDSSEDLNHINYKCHAKALQNYKATRCYSDCQEKVTFSCH